MNPGQESVDKYLATAPELVLLKLRAEVEALGHTNICSMQLRSKYRQCTCFQKDVLALFDRIISGAASAQPEQRP